MLVVVRIVAWAVAGVVSKSRSSGPVHTLSKPRLAVEEEAPPKSGSGGCCK